jgi:hypothetical protein
MRRLELGPASLAVAGALLSETGSGGGELQPCNRRSSRPYDVIRRRMRSFHFMLGPSPYARSVDRAAVVEVELPGLALEPRLAPLRGVSRNSGVPWIHLIAAECDRG